LTNYRYAIVRVIPLGAHMTLDTLTGAFLLVAPWLFGYRAFITPAQEYLHYLLGFGFFCFVGLTREKTDARALRMREA
jgi:hypothetical protein